MLVNALRAHMAEFGIIAPQGLRHVEILTKTCSQTRAAPGARALDLATIADQLNSTIGGPGRLLPVAAVDLFHFTVGQSEHEATIDVEAVQPG
jgi:hypothetical protein